ncbi:hypothetical protein AIOL_002966 [Candidatus Rhodobacter oscarellae]|uniref:Uncharacterized protein n=1 Tax=Candidatus Rhodobacter oscarellae TaxID=1675527 RepID=A0A0J9GWT6_9RHOB|nr:hypothetical protein AIOL_002966 [Candidatus Rhodobacter lobularis]
MTLAAMVGVCLVMLALALDGQAGLLTQAVVAALVLCIALVGRRFFMATTETLELTRAELRLASGRRLCALAEIEKVQRGAFGFQPSNGFVLHLTASAPSEWQLGLWWRLGRRLGVGGATSPAQNKAMAEALRLLLAEARGELDGLTR